MFVCFERVWHVLVYIVYSATLIAPRASPLVSCEYRERTSPRNNNRDRISEKRHNPCPLFLVACEVTWPLTLLSGHRFTSTIAIPLCLDLSHQTACSPSVYSPRTTAPTFTTTPLSTNKTTHSASCYPG